MPGVLNRLLIIHFAQFQYFTFNILHNLQLYGGIKKCECFQNESYISTSDTFSLVGFIDGHLWYKLIMTILKLWQMQIKVGQF